MASDLTQHYADMSENERLTRTPHGRLEFLRTQELIRRVLPEPSRILDVGGGTGVHARWLFADGHSVHVIDPIPGHVEAAAAVSGVTAEVGDARLLPAAGSSADAVLMLGPLYHLTESDDRATALNEAMRVLRPGGTLVAAAIGRYLSALETGANGRLNDPLVASMQTVITTGDYDGHVGFVRTHWHTAEELHAEVRAAGFGHVEIYGVEGPTWPTLDCAGLERLPSLLPAALHCARLLEQDPLMIHASAHLLAVASRVL